MPIIEQLQSYINEHIPIAKALGFKIDTLSDNKVIAWAPFAENVNHKMTVFGGSLHAVATLTCWCLMYQMLFDRLVEVEIVIAHSEVDYLQPVTADFRCEAVKATLGDWDKFWQILSRKGKARMILDAQIFQSGQLAVKYQGVFVVLQR